MDTAIGDTTIGEIGGILPLRIMPGLDNCSLYLS